MVSEVVHGQEFMMEFFDNDDGYDDEFLGRATVRTAAVADRHRQLQITYMSFFLRNLGKHKKMEI